VNEYIPEGGGRGGTIFRRPPLKKPLWAPEKNGSFACTGKRSAPCAGIFSGVHCIKTAIDAGKNGPVPTGYFSLPEAGKNRRKAVKGLDFLTVYLRVHAAYISEFMSYKL